jgi:hypothetical protein
VEKEFAVSILLVDDNPNPELTAEEAPSHIFAFSVDLAKLSRQQARENSLEFFVSIPIRLRYREPTIPERCRSELEQASSFRDLHVSLRSDFCRRGNLYPSDVASFVLIEPMVFLQEDAGSSQPVLVLSELPTSGSNPTVNASRNVDLLEKRKQLIVQV